MNASKAETFYRRDGNFAASRVFGLAMGLTSILGGFAAEAAGSAPLLSVSPGSLDFGAQVYGSTSLSKSIVLTNTGSAVAAFTSIAVTGSETDDFAETNTCGSALAVGANCTIAVTFAPVSAGVKSAVLTIQDNVSGSPQQVSLNGMGAVPPGLKLSTGILSFGSVSAGQKSSPQNVTLTNGSKLAVSLASIAVTGNEADDFLLTTNCSATLAAGARCVATVTFGPVSATSKSATLTITDSLSSAPQTVTLRGTGTAAVNPYVTLNSIFPSTVIAGSSAFTLTALGQGFSRNAVIQWNGSALSTTYVSQAEVQAEVPAKNVSAVATATITVQDSKATGGTSTVLPLNIKTATPDAVAFQITTGHSGAVSFKTLAFPSKSAWSVDVGGIPSYAVIAEGKVVVTVDVGAATHLLALDQATGAILWGPIELAGVANAAYDGGKIYVVSGSIGEPAIMQSFDLATGKSNWVTSLIGQYSFSSGPTALHGTVFTGGAGDGGTLYAVNGGSGAIEWTQGVSNGDDSTPAVTDEGVYVSYPCWTYGFEPTSGASLFYNDTGCDGGGGGTPVVANNVLYSPNGFGTYFGDTFNATTGTLLGAYVADVPPAIGTQSGFFLQGGTLSAIDLSDDTILWTFIGDGTLVTSPILVNNAVIIGSSSGNVYALDAATGKQTWTVDAGGTLLPGAHWGAGMPFAGLAAGDGLLVVPAGNNVVVYKLSSTP